MTIARAHLIDPSVTRWYHCITRCVRRAFLLGEGEGDRKLWIDRRLRELAEIFSISVTGFSVMDNHLHVHARLDPQVAAGWSDEGVVLALSDRRPAALDSPREGMREGFSLGSYLCPIWGDARRPDARANLHTSRSARLPGDSLR